MKYDLAAMNTSVRMVKRALEGNANAIAAAFMWINTPQGERFWDAAYEGVIEHPVKELQEIMDQINAENYGADQGA